MNIVTCRDMIVYVVLFSGGGGVFFLSMVSWSLI